MKPPAFPGLVTRGDWRSWAVFSPDGTYRYLLGRCWAELNEHEQSLIGTGDTWEVAETPVMFVMLNPSTADEAAPDPTIRKCVGFAKRQRHARIIVANHFALRSTDPRGLTAAADPVGPHNAEAVDWALSISASRVAAWGRFPSRRVRQLALRSMCEVKTCTTLQCYGKPKDGEPRHPLMLSYDTPLARLADARVGRAALDPANKEPQS